MTKRRKRTLYIAYVLLAGLFFLYYLFPSENLKNRITTQVRKANDACRMTIDTLRPTLLPGLAIEDLALFYHNTFLFNVEHLRLRPKLLSLFSSKKSIGFKGQTYEGELTGTITFTKVGEVTEPAITASFSGIQLQQIPAIQEQLAFDLSGGLSGNLRYDLKAPRAGGSARVKVTDCIVDLEIPLVDVGELTFQTIDADATFSGDLMEIKQGILKGPQLNGSVSGTIRLTNPASRSRLNLNITAAPHRALLSKLTVGIPAGLFPDLREGQGEISFKVFGTFEKPRIEFER